MNVEKLTDMQVALLVYGLERELDNSHGMRNLFRKQGEQMLDKLRREYEKRNLTWEDFYKEEAW